MSQCHCGSVVDARGLHSFVCKRAPGRAARHHALNDMVARSFAEAGVPVTKEPAGLSRTDRKRPDGLTLVPWQCGKPLCWDVTVICTLAESYVNGAAHEAGAAAEVAATRIMVKTGQFTTQCKDDNVICLKRQISFLLVD